MNAYGEQMSAWIGTFATQYMWLRVTIITEPPE